MVELLFSKLVMVSLRKFWFLVFLSFVVVLSLVTIFAMGIYLLGWDNFLSHRLAQLLPFPAAIVNGEIITLASVYDWADLHQQVVSFQSTYDFTSAQGKTNLLRERQYILAKLIDNKIIADLTLKNGIVITSPEINQYYQYLLSQFAIDSEQAELEIQNLFGLSVREFKEMFVLPDLRAAKLQMAWLRQDSSSSAYKLAKSVRKELDAGMDFVKAAALYSLDEKSKYLGGDLGFVTRRELPPWIADVVFGLKVGEVSEIVVTPEGYQIFQVAAKTQDGNQIQLRQILVSGPDFSDYLLEQKKNYRVYVFEKI